MSPTTIRIDDKTKKEGQKLDSELGMPFSAFINALLKKAVREGGVDLHTVPLTENGFTPAFEQSVLKAHKAGSYKSYKSVKEMIKKAK